MKKNLVAAAVVLLPMFLLPACAASGATRKSAVEKTAPAARVDNRTKLLGTWTIEVYEADMVFVYTFQNDGYVHSNIYRNGIKTRDGYLIYKAADTTLSLRDASAERTMEYSVTPDGKGLLIKNFWGQGIDVIGVKK
jgi:hypothetical protein